jgi:hypothetical protein
MSRQRNFSPRRHKLFGFENITANNGWAMAIVGATTVFLGLVILSFVISQIHKILNLWEQKDKFLNRFKKQAQTGEPKTIKAPVSIQRRLPSVKELTSIYRPLVEQLKQPFGLLQLFEISNKMDLPHPHLSIKYLQEAGVLVPQGDGTFTWDKQKAN